jgi:hypothetical protein
MPEIDTGGWREASSRVHQPDEKHPYGYRHAVYERVGR